MQVLYKVLHKKKLSKMNVHENIPFLNKVSNKEVLFLNIISLASIDRYRIAAVLKMEKKLLTFVLSIVQVTVTNYNAYGFSSRNLRRYLLGRTVTKLTLLLSKVYFFPNPIDPSNLEFLVLFRFAIFFPSKRSSASKVEVILSTVQRLRRIRLYIEL